MATYKLTLEYDGTGYCGWQVQPNGPSVQGAVESALHRLLGVEIRIRAAGRTDSGVHARGQVASFRADCPVPTNKLAEALNTRLPPDIACRKAEEAESGFDPRHDCVRKRYSYSFLVGSIRPALARRQFWHLKRPTSITAMQDAASLFVGSHDFTSFCNQERAGEDNIRTVDRSELIVHPTDDVGNTALTFVIEGRSFLYNMVRAIAGTLADVGAGRFRPEEIGALLERRERSCAGQGAPPWGLCLEWVKYPNDALD